jgi:Tfp pilus assembly protein PilE
MTAIKGWVYLIMGAIMIASSQLVKYEDGTKPLRVFLYVGILFVIIGIGKYIIKRGAKEEQNSQPVNQAMTQEQMHQQNRAQHRAHQSFNQQINSSSQQEPSNFFRGKHQVQTAGKQPVQHASIIACPLCGTRHYDYAHYCMRCGTRIKDIRER